MLKPSQRSVLWVSCAVLYTALSAHASIIQFSGIDPNGADTRIAHPNSDAARNAFLSNLTGVGTETFESFTPNTTPALLTFPGAGTATFSGNPVVRSQPTGTNGAGSYPISGNQYLEAATSSFSISFSQPVAAFGFYGVDIGDIGGTLILHLTNGAATALTVPAAPQNTANGSVLYFGFYGNTVADSFTGISFQNTNIADFFAFDNMTIGSLAQVTPTVPEPSSVTLVGIGLAGLVGYGWRKRKLGGSAS